MVTPKKIYRLATGALIADSAWEQGCSVVHHSLMAMLIAGAFANLANCFYSRMREQIRRNKLLLTLFVIHKLKMSSYNNDMSEEAQIALAIALSEQDSAETVNYVSDSRSTRNNYDSNTKKRKVAVDDSYYIRQLKQGFAELYKDKVGADTLLVLKPSNVKINCHSLVLSVWSETFRVLLKGKLFELSFFNL
jgi:hypothetical protein